MKAITRFTSTLISIVAAFSFCGSLRGSAALTEEQESIVYDAILNGLENHQYAIDFDESIRNTITKDEENKQVIRGILNHVSYCNKEGLLYSGAMNVLSGRDSDDNEYINGICVTYSENLSNYNTVYQGYLMSIQEILNGIPEGADTYEIAKYLHDYILTTYQYDYAVNEWNNSTTRAYEAHNAFGLLKNGMGVCDGISKLYAILLTESGIECHVVTSDTLKHAWNIINVDGEWLYADLTWDYSNSYYELSYLNFFKTEEEMVVTGHTSGDWTLDNGKPANSLYPETEASEDKLPAEAMTEEATEEEATEEEVQVSLVEISNLSAGAEACDIEAETEEETVYEEATMISEEPEPSNEDSAMIFSENVSLRGDIDGNGEADIIDLLILYHYVSGCGHLTQEQFLAADLCKDGEVDIYDLALMKRILVENR